MTQATSNPPEPRPAPGARDLDTHTGPAGPAALAGRLRLNRGGLAGALLTLFLMEVGRQCRARRLLVVLVLFALPVAFAALAHVYSPESLDTDEVEVNLVFYFIPHALVPLTALLYATGMIQDEIEEQTLTYLLVRPLPKSLIYITKLLATFAVTSLLVGGFTMATDAAIFWGTDQFWTQVVADRAPRIAALVALALLAYNALFGMMSLVVKRTMAVGVAYIVVLEGVVANMDFVARWLTVMFYFRVLSERWLELRVSDWSIDLNTAPDISTSVQILLGASLVATVLAAVIFSTREFRVKTPEGT